MNYPGLASFVAPARARPEIWRTAIGLLLIGVISWASVFGLFALIAQHIGALRLSLLLGEIARAGTPRGLLMVLATFAPMVLASFAVVRALHRRSAATLFGAGALRDFLRVGVPLTGLALVLAPLAALDGNVGRSVPPMTVLSWMPLALPLLLVQIGAEELIFRGYLLQQLALRFRARWIWMVIPSALFGVLHYAPGDFGPNATLMALWAMGFGCLAADLTARAGNLGPALAFHFANNLSAMFLVGLYGQLDGLSLYTIVINARDPAAVLPYLAIDSLSMGVSWLLARLILRR